MCSRILGTCASNIMVLILPIITLLLVYPGKLLLKWRTWNWTLSLILINTCSSRKGSGGGVAMISHRYARGNAPGMKNYDSSKRNNYIMYLDANNLYGWAMSQPLPMSNFKWLTDEEMEEWDVMMVLDVSPRGYILECDLSKYLYIDVYFIKCNVSFLHISDYPRDFTKCNVSFLCISEYPHELHDLHKDYPLAPERLQIEENLLSDYQRHLLQDEGFSKPPPKLVPNLCNKTNYVIH